MPNPPYLAYLHHPWVENRLKQLSMRGRIGQLIHVPAWSDREESHAEDLLRLISDEGIGGVTFFQGSAEAQFRLTQRLQAHAELPLMISIDAEWGLAMRLDGAPAMPYAMTLGAANDPVITRALAHQLAQQCRQIGVHVNFAPVVDLNTEPRNPVIGFRSFGQKISTVVEQARAFSQGLIDGGVLPVIKHFPGHGDTQQDSHLTLPHLQHERKRLDQVELQPFKQLIEAGIGGIMTAHLQVDAFDPTPHTPATLSRPIIEDLLRKSMGYRGLIFTDALDMQGIANYYGPAEAAERALIAGNDILVFCSDVRGTRVRILQSLEKGLITENDIEIRCRRVLAAKAYLGLIQEDLSTQTLTASLVPPIWQELAQECFQRAIQSQGEIEIDWEKERIASLTVQVAPLEDGLKHHQLTRGGGQDSSFSCLDLLPTHQRMLNPDQLPTPEQIDHLLLVLQGLSPKAGLNYGLRESDLQLIRKLSDLYPMTLISFGRDEVISLIFPDGDACPTLIAWQDAPEAHQAVAQRLFAAAD